MNKFTEYQLAVQQALASLPVGPDGEVYMTSLNNRQKGTIAGRVGINSSGVAAMLVVQATHRASTPEEIENWKKEQAIKKALIEAEAARKDGKVNLDMNEFLAKFAALLSPAAAEHSVPVPAIPVPAATPSRPAQHSKSPASAV